MIEQKTTINEVLDILDKMEFFGGCRAGRELWQNKPEKVQNEDIENFNRDIQKIREYLKANTWTPVTERTPEDFEWVLVWFKDHLTGNCGCDFAYQVEDVWHGSCLGHSRSVLAWMPKPPDYEGECNG